MLWTLRRGNAVFAGVLLKEYGNKIYCLEFNMKKIFLFLMLVIPLILAVAWYLRHDIVKFSLDVALQRSLPANISVERIVLDIPGGRVDLYGISAQNPPGFPEEELFRSDVVTARFRMRGRNLLRGFEVTDVEVHSPRVFAERLRNGTLNFENFEPAPPGGPPSRLPIVEVKPFSGEMERGTETGIAWGLSEVLILREPLPVEIKEGRLTFRDDMVAESPFYVMFGGVETIVHLTIDDSFQVSHVRTNGHGFIDDDPSQKVRWRISADLTEPHLRMSSRVKPENVDLVPFKPYYDRYAPVDISSARVSGTIIYDLHAGRVGSDNTLILRDLEFSRKDPGRVSGFWEASITDIVRYLESAPGEVVFDFKIKGPLDNPSFYPGPNVSRAMQRMAVDTIGQIIRGVVDPGEDAPEPSGKSDVERAIGIFQDLIRR